MLKTTNKYNSVLTGLASGLILPAIASLFFGLYNINRFGTLTEMYERIITMGVMEELISLFLVPNLGLFFLFMWKNKILSSRGVIFATMIWGAVMLYFKFF